MTDLFPQALEEQMARIRIAALVDELAQDALNEIAAMVREANAYINRTTAQRARRLAERARA